MEDQELTKVSVSATPSGDGSLVVINCWDVRGI